MNLLSFCLRATFLLAGMSAVFGDVAPVVFMHPQAQAIPAERSVSFKVAASGTAPFTYQWYKSSDPDPVLLEGAQSSTLVLDHITEADEAAYYCRVTNGAGFDESNAAQLTVVPAIGTTWTQVFSPDMIPTVTPGHILGVDYLPNGETWLLGLGFAQKSTNNGATFSPVEGLPSMPWKGVSWANSRYMVMTQGNDIYTIGNGDTNFRPISLSNHIPESLYWDGAKWIAYAFRETGSAGSVCFTTNADAFGWTSNMLASSGGLAPDTVKYYQGVYFGTDVMTLHYVVSGGGIFWKNFHYPPPVDGLTNRTRGTAVGDGKFLGFSANKIDIFDIQTSTWTTYPFDGGTADYFRAVYGNGIWMVLGIDLTSSSQFVKTSPDGVTWTDRTEDIGVSMTFRDIAYAPNAFIITGDKAIAVRSTTEAPVPPEFTLHPEPVSTLAGQSVILNAEVLEVGAGFQWFKDGAPASSASGNTALTIPNAQGAHSGLYFLRAFNGDGYTDSRPARVTVRPSVPGPFNGIAGLPEGTPQEVIWGNGQYLLLLDTPSGTSLLKSLDGQEFTHLYDFPIGVNVHRMTHGSGSHWVAGGEGGIYRSMDDGANWAQVDHVMPRGFFYLNNRYYATFTSSPYLHTSTDGADWTAIDIGFPVAVNDIAYGQGRWVAVGSSGYIGDSQNGENFQSGFPPLGPLPFINIAFGNGIFLASISGSKDLAVSRDGFAWTIRKNAAPYTASRLEFVDGFFVSSVPAEYAFSTDGIHWVTQTLPLSSITPQVTAGPDRMLMVSDKLRASAPYASNSRLVTFSVTGPGTASPPPGAYLLELHSSITFTAAPSANAGINEWRVNSAVVTPDPGPDIFLLADLTEPTVVEVAFEAHPFPFDGWLQTHFDEDQMGQPDTSGTTANPDSDLWDNLMEYALGGDPWNREATQSYPRLDPGPDTGVFLYIYPRSKYAMGVTYNARFREYLSSEWTSFGPGTFLVETPELEIWRVEIPVTLSGNGFITLEVLPD